MTDSTYSFEYNRDSQVLNSVGIRNSVFRIRIQSKNHEAEIRKIIIHRLKKKTKQKRFVFIIC